jgi:hypothetical protein
MFFPSCDVTTPVTFPAGNSIEFGGLNIPNDSSTDPKNPSPPKTTKDPASQNAQWKCCPRLWSLAILRIVTISQTTPKAAKAQSKADPMRVSLGNS